MSEYEERLYDIMEDAIKKLHQAGIFPSENLIGIKENKRAKKRLGCCRQIYQNGVLMYELEISTVLKDAEEKQLKEVIIHELLHTCPGCLNHGSLWKKYAAKMNQMYGYNIQRVAKTTEEASTAYKYRYKIVCENCGMTACRMKKSKVVSNVKQYRCAKCGGTLRVEKI